MTNLIIHHQGIGKADTLTGNINDGNLTLNGVPVLDKVGIARMKANPALGFTRTITMKDGSSKTVNVSFPSKDLPRGSQEPVKARATFISDKVPPLTKAVTTPDGGNPLAYCFLGGITMVRKWAVNPMVRMSLGNNANFVTEGMSVANALAALTAATKTWDDATNQNLFSDMGANVTTAGSQKKDNVNAVFFLPFAVGSSGIAMTGSWYWTYANGKTSQHKFAGTLDDPYQLIESDITMNSRNAWTATGEANKLDFQSVVLHELGHTLGLGDLYGKSAFAKDTRQVMHYYSGKKWTLGNGDANGLWRLYG